VSYVQGENNHHARQVIESKYMSSRSDLPEGEMGLIYRRNNNKELMLQSLDDLSRLALDCLRINNPGE
jgi:hypothetical protein